MIRILIVDDHPMVRSGLAGILGRQRDMVVVGEAGDGESAVARYLETAPDVTLMDLNLPGMDGWTAIAAIRARDANARILAVSSLAGDEDVHRALRAGAKGYLLKDADAEEIAASVRAAMAGLRHVPQGAAEALAARVEYEELSEREMQVLRLIAGGSSNKEIGAGLGLSESTVKWHINSILSKLHVDDRTGAVTLALRRGLIRLR